MSLNLSSEADEVFGLVDSGVDGDDGRVDGGVVIVIFSDEFVVEVGDGLGDWVGGDEVVEVSLEGPDFLDCRDELLGCGFPDEDGMCELVVGTGSKEYARL